MHSPRQRLALLAAMAALQTAAFLPLAAAGAAPDADRRQPGSAPASPVLVAYDFETPRPTGPDTFWIREPQDTEVTLSRAFHVGGERSLRLREVAGNEDFAELLSYFRETRSGVVLIQLYVMLADPRERFNIGLAGERWFLSRTQHGHAVWIQTTDGELVHQTRDGWQTLLTPRPFTWYFVDLVYDVDRGVYALRIHEEGREEPLVDLHDQPAYHGHRESSVRFFSVIGDLEDEGRTDVFLDDLLIATDPAVRQRPFVAPGRRRFFVESHAAGAPPATDAERDDLFHAARVALAGAPAAKAAIPAGGESDLVERAADEAFRGRDLAFAEQLYSAVVDQPDRRIRVLLKLADIAHLRGDVERERTLRESFYGRLRLEEESAPPPAD
jgi:hypothetical protein